MLFFHHHPSATDQLQQAEKTKALYMEQIEKYKKEKEQLLMRQVELWGIFNLSAELEKEYHAVSEKVPTTIQKIDSLEKYVSDLSMGIYKCNQGSCKALEDSLAQQASFEQLVSS